MPAAMGPSQFAPPTIATRAGSKVLARFSIAMLAAVCSKVVLNPTIG